MLEFVKDILGPRPDRTVCALSLFCERHAAREAASLAGARAALNNVLILAQDGLVAAINGGDQVAIAAARSQLQLAQAAAETRPPTLLGALRAAWARAPAAERMELAQKEAAADLALGAACLEYEERVSLLLRAASLHKAVLFERRKREPAAAGSQAAPVTEHGAHGSFISDTSQFAASASSLNTSAAADVIASADSLMSAAIIRPSARIVDRASAALAGWGEPVASAVHTSAAGAAGGKRKGPVSSGRGPHKKSVTVPVASKTEI
jgi:hypothetical protein